MTTEAHVRMVGPVIRGVDNELAEAVIEAMEIDNPDTDIVVDDRGGYIRISAAQRCRLTRASLSEVLGHEFSLAELEPSLSAFAGRINADENEIVWFLDRED
ncbi:MmoB/DmpM family protein [Pseudonocardia sp.]|uniref:MmoB/DmpM family protein n=1 Tax=Pseudonocardia sp. TaxID=60912 RepID=UPI002609F828|nr:MmoB/DmpM family protein [Pseudonocardia sp.]MCW2719497.1 monooxygenase component MmoB/DmpM [Pseudonocardia sp.]MDT7615395.1 toluene monooxygenase system protein [Pseudonocardiales bacterium]